ncbi:hypothetical protein D3C78_991650 [compost metagenome]
MSSLIEATKYKASTCPRQVERLSFWLDDFNAAESKKDCERCRHLVKLAVNAGLLTQGESLAFYKRSKLSV